MPKNSASAVGRDGKCSMPLISQIVELKASPIFHNLGSARIGAFPQNVKMETRKNGGPNYLKAWRDRRRMTLEELAEAIGTSASVIGYLESGERGLSAKWLRRLAPALKITPGLLLDHHPDKLSDDMIKMWTNATEEKKQQITDMAKIILKDGTNG